MSLTWLTQLAWPTIISVAALLVSLALAIREFSVRAIPFGWVHELSQTQHGAWQYIGQVAYITNVGKRPFTLEALGVMNETKDGVSSFVGEFTWMPDDAPIRNPEAPLMIQPGELQTFRFPAARFPKGGPPLSMQIVRRNPWHWIFGQKEAARRWVTLTSPNNKVGNTKATRQKPAAGT